MDDIDYLHSFPIVLLYDPLSMMSPIGCTSLGGEEYDYILFVWIGGILECDYILLDHIVWLSIYRDDDDMFDIFSSF